MSNSLDVPSLDSLILASPMADKIFEKLRENVQNGNPLLGIKVLLRLSDDSQRKYYHLVHFPQLIVESLIMNTQFNEANNVVKEFDDLRVTYLTIQTNWSRTTIPLCRMHRRQSAFPILQFH